MENPARSPAGTPPNWVFDHINVSMGHRDALQSLFGDVMGMQAGFRPPFPFPGLWLYADGQAVIHAVDDARLAQSDGGLRFGHIAFRSDQAAADLLARLQASGLHFRVARIPQENTLQIFVPLPGGFVVELDVPDDPALPLSYVYSPQRVGPGSE